MNRPHLRINCVDPGEDSCPGRISDRILAPSRTRLSKPSRHRTGTRPWSFPKPTQPQRAPVRWARDIHSSVPVRGPTRPSIPPSLPQLEEVYPKAESPKTIYFFLFWSFIFFSSDRPLNESTPDKIRQYHGDYNNSPSHPLLLSSLCQILLVRLVVPAVSTSHMVLSAGPTL